MRFVKAQQALHIRARLHRHAHAHRRRAVPGGCALTQLRCSRGLGCRTGSLRSRCLAMLMRLPQPLKPPAARAYFRFTACVPAPHHRPQLATKLTITYSDESKNMPFIGEWLILKSGNHDIALPEIALHINLRIFLLPPHRRDQSDVTRLLFCPFLCHRIEGEFSGGRSRPSPAW